MWSFLKCLCVKLLKSVCCYVPLKKWSLNITILNYISVIKVGSVCTKVVKATEQRARLIITFPGVFLSAILGKKSPKSAEVQIRFHNLKAELFG